MTCPSCGFRHAPQHRFCGSCGVELPAAAPPESAVDEINRPVGAPYHQDRAVGVPQRGRTPAEPAYAGPSDDAFPYYIPPGRVVLLTLLSSGLYILYWMYVTWRQYRDHTGEVAYPIMHALTLMVPIYSLFRLHAHIRVYQELMQQRGVPTTLNPLRTVLVYLGVFLLGLVSLMMPAESTITAAQQASYLVISVSQATLLAWIMWQAQTNLNRFWRHRLGMRLGWMRFSLAELVLVLLGLLLWGMLLVLLIDPSLLPTDAAIEPAPAS